MVSPAGARTGSPWTRGGFTIVHKRLERGTFTFEVVPEAENDVA
jgi:hypothetical protein